MAVAHCWPPEVKCEIPPGQGLYYNALVRRKESSSPCKFYLGRQFQDMRL
jgi:hypothetical protein